MGHSTGDKQSLVCRFASSKVKYQGAKFGVQIKDPRYPISHITIDCDNVLHGWNVTVQSIQQKRITYGKSLTDFAQSMTGIMKVHSALIRTMRDPEVYDHN